MNTRHIITNESWFGGGNGYYTDKFKIIRVEKIAKIFHSSLEKICEENKKGVIKSTKKVV